MPTYYYAGGKRVSLHRDTHRVAVEMARAGTTDLLARVKKAAMLGTPLPSGVAVIKRSALSDVDRHALEQAGALQPVFSWGEVVAVPMSDVRIEFEKKGGRERALAAVAESGIDAEIVSDREGLIVVQTKSGSGKDALRLANYVYEHASPSASAPRMLQMTRKPDVSPRKVALSKRVR